MNNRRKLIFSLGAGALATTFNSFAQPRDKVYRIGILFSNAAASAKWQVDVFIQALQEFGYVENKNILFEHRYAEGNFERLPPMAAELVQLKVDVIFVNNTPPALAAKQATSSIPIVFAGVASPVENGVIASLARPGHNITGTSNITTELTGKRLQILKEAFPKTVRIAVINSIQPVSDLQFSAVQSEAKKLGMDILRIELRRREDFEQQYEQVRKGRADALYPLDNAINNQLRNLLVDFASQYQLPVIYGSKQYVDAGGLMSYGADLLANYRRGAAFVDKILNGAKPADLPVERPTKFELVINMKTAKALGMKISNSILVQATNVIE